MLEKHNGFAVKLKEKVPNFAPLVLNIINVCSI